MVFYSVLPVLCTTLQVAMAKVMEQGPVLVLTFMVQQIMILRDAVGNIIEGGEVSICTLVNIIMISHSNLYCS